MKVTRRELARLLALTAAVAPARAAAPTEPVKSPADLAKHRSEELAAFPVPMSTEPSFQFKA